ncbi:MAG: VacJ family lipoprotein [Betaproteobacteria bacterium]|nr:VacJ family lipoprotein [Betaproteobacteria bacterium]
MTPQPRRSPAVTRLAVALALCALGALAGGCATVAPAGTEPVAANPVDPWENFNRKVYAFNDGLDEALLRPLSEAYRDVVPELVRTGVDNFFGNVYDAWSAVNQLLQGKLEDSLVMGTRVATNTLFGLGGLLDPATEMRLTRRSEDFGQTLGHWGVPNGPFLMLPLFGPSTIRDATGLWVDRQVSPAQLSDSETKRWVIGGMEVVNVRTKLLQTLRLLDDVALDKYAFVRDAYLARRRDAVFDGAPPFEDLGDDWEDEPPAAAPAPPAAASAPQTPR